MAGGIPRPIPDWRRGRANRFHDFHQSWTVTIRNALNAGLLPAGYFAMVEQQSGGPEPDIVTLALKPPPGSGAPTGTALAPPPRTRFVTRTESAAYARKANRVTVRHPDGGGVAVIEIVSPGNKDSRHVLRAFARKAVQLLQAGVHLLTVDLFPPSRRDPQGIHKVIWVRLRDEPFELPSDKPLTVAAYSAGTEIVGSIEPVAVGDPLPEMPCLPHPGLVRLLPAGGDVSDRRGAVPRAAEGAAGVPSRGVTVPTADVRGGGNLRPGHGQNLHPEQ